MTEQGFTTAFVVDGTPGDAFAAITDVRGWWSEDVEGRTDQAGAEFTYRYGDVHHCRIRVTETVPDRRVSWVVVDNHFEFTEDQTEWTGTTISFTIGEAEGGTEVRFTHHGLLPAHECFEVCSTAWGFYVNDSLRNLIATGAGKPNPRGEL
ncbi:SRPBCC family protein [Saccharothrix australiensis]|uniref:Uncharacterized protein YndB with AHSA1/START domain n=1 Tax=Saccharothrix australiensis TaxID=2072 RepID=A0A495W348_9PSEU|nr:SRPBCC domain-containing protein [Saccharothrix australiensis]RKT55185.1 uncharacterized protein YndB with AHSA1/START domain [Saccharothrix australiensis]